MLTVTQEQEALLSFSLWLSLDFDVNNERKRNMTMSKGAVKARLYIGGLKSLFAEMHDALEEVEQTGKMPMNLFSALEDVKGAVDITLNQLKASAVKCCDHCEDHGEEQDDCDDDEEEQKGCDGCCGDCSSDEEEAEDVLLDDDDEEASPFKGKKKLGKRSSLKSEGEEKKGSKGKKVILH